jgi:ubiquinone/menaquinone biosynthesis C-methylase UbiE
VYAEDSEATLRRAKKLRDRKDWHNIVLLQDDAAHLNLPKMVDGVLFSLSYSVMANSREVLGQVWKYLKPVKRLVIMIGKLGTA